MRHAAAVACLCLSVAVAPASAIIVRHDVAESEVRALGHKHRAVLVALGLHAEDDGAPMLYSGMGTLVAPDWVLTAAHAAVEIKAGPSLPDHFVFVNGRGYAVSRIIMHPTWKEGSDDNDIALIQLKRPVADASPACVYAGQDEQGRVATLVGQGRPGTGLTGPGERDGIIRGATTHVDVAETTTLRWKFRSPDDPLATPMQGISGPGDSGGPALLPVGDRMCVAGVSSVQRIEVEVGTPPGQAPGRGRYGVVEVYTRVSAYVPWIRETAGLR